MGWLRAQRGLRGGEFQFQWDVQPVAGGVLGLDGQYDIVRATFTDGTNVPRFRRRGLAAEFISGAPNGSRG